MHRPLGFRVDDKPHFISVIWDPRLTLSGLVRDVPLVVAWHRKSQDTLRISTQQNADTTVITLEGRIAGPWATELSRTWSELAASLGTRKLSIDLRNSTYADATGIQVLRKIYAQTAAEFVTGTPWTQYLAEEITRQNATQTEEEF